MCSENADGMENEQNQVRLLMQTQFRQLHSGV